MVCGILSLITPTRIYLLMAEISAPRRLELHPFTLMEEAISFGINLEVSGDFYNEADKILHFPYSVFTSWIFFSFEKRNLTRLLPI